MKILIVILILITFDYINSPSNANLNMPSFKDLTGKTFHRLTVISRDFSKKRTSWKCVCVCGNTCITSSSNLVMGVSKSCGCYQVDQLRKALTKHGESNKTKEWNAWSHIIRRCNDTTSKDYFRYGARGITVCKRWLTYSNFLADVGRSPSPKHSIDRIDNNKNYEPGNCRWSTQKEQANNRRTSRIITYNGESRTVSQWCDYLKIGYTRTVNRLRRGHSIEYVLGFTEKIT